jgi:hypothetical protein
LCNVLMGHLKNVFHCKIYEVYVKVKFVAVFAATTSLAAVLNSVSTLTLFKLSSCKLSN